MVTWQEIVEKYGEDVVKKIVDSNMLDGITVRILPSGEIDIPEVDILRAIRAICGEDVDDWD